MVFLRPFGGSPTDPFQRFYRKTILWETLSHPNILKLVGVQEDRKIGKFVVVSEWMEDGTIMEYIEDHYVNRLELVRDFASPTVPSSEI